MTEQEQETMSQTHRTKILEQTEKPALRSKKFLCWGAQQLLMAAMAITALVRQPELGWPLAAFMCGIVFMMGTSTMYLIGKQAALDTTVRGFALVGRVAGLSNSFEKVQHSQKEEGAE